MYIRGQQRDYDEWAALGNPSWSWDACLPYFRKLEHNDLGEGPTHGTAGPLWASTVPRGHPLVDAFLAAGNSQGVPTVDDFNSGPQEGVGYFQLSTRNGFRCSTATAYLRPARRRPGLRIETDAHATRVVFDGLRAIGIRYRKGDVTHEVRARREVLLCAGTFQSPQLLQASGVGPASHLRELDIPVVLGLDGIGENLQDHLQVRLMYEVSERITTNDALSTLGGRIGMGLQWLFNRSGPLAVGINMAGMFCRALPDENPTPDTQFHFATLSADHAAGQVHAFSGCTYSVCQLRPESRGSIRISSSDTRDAPAIRFNYLSTGFDQRSTIAAVKFARRIADSASMARFMKREFRPGPDVRTDDEILAFCREYASTIFHPVGTARMGPATDRLAVVDERLRVHGIANLRVVDCSVMPTLVSGNTNVPAVMIAEKAADIVRADAISERR
jgi:choline dehydrogenase